MSITRAAISLLMTFTCTCAEAAAYYVERAELVGATKCALTERQAYSNLSHEQPQIPIYVDRLLGGHCIGHGRGLVLHRSELSRSAADIGDASQFSQITIFIPSRDVKKGAILAPKHGFKLYYSEGSSAWIHKGAGNYGEKNRGRIRVIDVRPDAVVLEIALEIELKDARTEQSTRRNYEFDGSFDRTTLQSLSRCLGASPNCRR